MIVADYDMKRLCQGLIEAPGVLTSVLDRSIASAQQSIAANGTSRGRGAMARYWFCIANDQPKFNTNSTGGVWLERCDVVVRTERQLATGSGRLVDSHQAPDLDGDAFAAEFSRNFARIASQHRSLADLENLFHLHALLRAAGYTGLLGKLDSAALRDDIPLLAPSSLPESMPGLANGKLVRLTNDLGNGRIQQLVLAPVISGGVDLGVRAATGSFAKAIPHLAARLELALAARPSSSAVLWRTQEK